MKDLSKSVLVLCLVWGTSLALTSCTAIEGIFKAGVWTGIIIVVLIIAIIIYLVTRGRK